MAGRHARAPETPDGLTPAHQRSGTIVAVALVAALAVLLVAVVLSFVDAPGGSSPAADGDRTTTAAPTTPGGSSSAPPDDSGTTSAPPSEPVGDPATVPAETPDDPGEPSPTTAAPDGPAAERLPLLVLNNSTITGLASRAADDFTAAGWPVADVGNLRGRIRETTVYYAPGAEASARALAGEFPQVTRVLPRIDGLPGDAALTVVVTRYYAESAGA